MIYMKWGEYDKAIEGFTEALKLSLENKDDNQWWEGHYYRRLGLVYFYKGDYVNASKNYLKSFKINQSIENNKSNKSNKSSIKSLCSYGYVEELLGNHNLAKEKMSECSSWILENQKEIEHDHDNDHDTYETIWPLYLYHKHLNQEDKASKYLNMAYENIGKKQIDKYHTHPNKDTYPGFFWRRDIIKIYEASLNQ